jgi:hypothetical protein
VQSHTNPALHVEESYRSSDRLRPFGKTEIGSLVRTTWAIEKLTASGSGRDLDLRRRKHLQEVRRQPPAGLPKLQPDYLPCPWIEFSQTRLGLLRYSGVGIVALEPNPCDIRVGVVVAIDAHGHSLASPPERHDARSREILAVGMLVDHHEPPSHDLPVGAPSVAPPFVVAREHGRLYVVPSEPQSLCLVERMAGPANGRWSR